MNRQQKVKISEQELYEICHRIVLGEHFYQNSFSPPVRLNDVVEKHFKLLYDMEKPKAYWAHKSWNTFFLMSTVGFFFLMTKIAIEAYWGIK